MEYDKEILTFQEQLDLLEERGLIIENPTEAINFLKSISYYRLSGYWWSLQTDTTRHEFMEGTKFSEIINRYTFDRKLRLIVFDAIERIEVALRTSLIYYLSHETKDWNWFEDSKHFKNKHHFHETLDSIDRELNQKKQVFIVTHNNKYGESKRPPCLKTLEIVSLGTLSKLYYNIRSTHPAKAKISNSIGLSSVSDAESWLRTISIIRNKVAHHSRLWNDKLPFQMGWLSRPKSKWISKPDDRGLQRIYYFLSAVLYILDTVSNEHSIKSRLKTLIVARSKSITLQSMGFPTDWLDQEIWRD